MDSGLHVGSERAELSARALLGERTLRMEATVAFSGYSAKQVFDIMGDPARITDWYLLAKSVRAECAAADQPFIVDFTLFGEVTEQVLFWDPPRSYIYIARGRDFPILDYHAEIAVEENGADSGLLFWRIYFDRVSGSHQQNLLPVILPPVTEASIQRLSHMIGGTECSLVNDFETPLIGD
ncbi:MAG: SRPBCC family protein [Cellvibrionales bacterium]|jgi:hypothetical protein